VKELNDRKPNRSRRNPMRNTSTTMAVTLLTALILAFSSISAPETASAQYRHREGNLPGMHEFPTTLAIMAGVAVVGTVTYLIIKKSNKDKDEGESEEDESIEDSEEETEESCVDQNSTILAAAMPTERRSSIVPYLGIEQVDREAPFCESPRRLSDMTVKVGLSFGF
jgi:hypothetical protein